MQAIQVFPTGFYDDTHPWILYNTGDYSRVTPNYGGLSLYDDGVSNVYEQGSTIQFSLWGNGVTLYRVTDNLSDDVEVCVGSLCKTWAGFSQSPAIAFIEFVDLGYGQHDVTITLTEANPNIGLLLDYIYVHPPAAQPTLEPQQIEVTLEVNETYLESWEIQEQPVAVQYTITGGEMLISILMVISLFLVGIVGLSQLWRGR